MLIKQERNRAGVIIIEEDRIAVIKRLKDNVTYYVFPVGGIEAGETPEQAAKREAYEELGVEVDIKDCIAQVQYGGLQYYFRAKIVSGELGTGQGEEFLRDSVYIPMWVQIEQLLTLDVRPYKVMCLVQTIISAENRQKREDSYAL